MRLDEVRHPLRGLLSELGLEFNFQNAVPLKVSKFIIINQANNEDTLEKLLILCWQLVKRMIDADIGSPPVISST